MRRGRPLLILRSIGQRSRSFELEIGIFCPLNRIENLLLDYYEVNTSKVKVV